MLRRRRPQVCGFPRPRTTRLPKLVVMRTFTVSIATKLGLAAAIILRWYILSSSATVNLACHFYLSLSLDLSYKMHSRSRTSPAPASRGLSPRSSKKQQPNEEVSHCPSDYQCDNKEYRSRFNCRSDMSRYVDSGIQQSHFAISINGDVGKAKLHMEDLHGVLRQFMS